MNKKYYKIVILTVAFSLYVMSALTCLAKENAEVQESETFNMEEFENPLKDGQTFEEDPVPGEGEFLVTIEDGGGDKKSKTAPEKIILNQKRVLLHIGKKKKMSVVKVKPSTASAEVFWVSKNKKVAIVSKSGKIVAKRAGKTTITAVSKKNPNIKATIKVMVKK